MEKNTNKTKTTTNTETTKAMNAPSYMFYSKVLDKPFETVEELAAAEAVHFDKINAKEAAAAQKKSDAKKVEDAFKALNMARRVYKEKLAQLTTEYAESLENLKKAYELGIADIHNALASAEEAYEKALKEFTSKYDSYHETLKDGDFETTISKQTVSNPKTSADLSKLADLFDLMFRF
jgi:predicted  nucleic acid-binding Zn-ribbon protein